MNKIKVVAYARVSTGSEEQLTSLSHQSSYFERVCSEHGEYELTKIYADRGISGTSLNKRPQFNNMLEDAGLDLELMKNGEIHLLQSDREPKFKMILVKDSSRLARNILIFDAIEKLRRKGVYILFTDINKSTEDRTNDPILKIIMTLDAEESFAKGRKVAFGHKQSMLHEVPVITTTSFGYSKVNKKELKIEDEQAEIVRFIYDLYVNEKIGIRGIVRACGDRNFKSKRGKSLGQSTITLILKNPIYKGTLVRGKHDFSTLTQDKIDMLKLKPEEEWVIVDAHVGIPVLIDAETWEKAQDIMNKRVQVQGVRGKRKSKSKYSSLLKCYKCGATYRANTDRGRKFYNCGTKREHGTDACNAFNVNETFIDEKITTFSNTFYKEYIENEVEGATEDINMIMVELAKKYSLVKDNEYDKKLDKELLELTHKQARLLDSYVDEIIDKEQFKNKKSELDKKIEIVSKDLLLFSTSKEDFISELHEMDDARNHLEKLEDDNVITIEEMINEIDYIEVHTMTLDEYNAVVLQNKLLKERGAYNYHKTIPPYIEIKVQLKPKFKAITLVEEMMGKYDIKSQLGLSKLVLDYSFSEYFYMYID